MMDCIIAIILMGMIAFGIIVCIFMVWWFGIAVKLIGMMFGKFDDDNYPY